MWQSGNQAWSSVYGGGNIGVGEIEEDVNDIDPDPELGILERSLLVQCQQAGRGQRPERVPDVVLKELVR